MSPAKRYLPSQDAFSYSEQCITDTIAIRGSYHALSLCIYGSLCPAPQPLIPPGDSFVSNSPATPLKYELQSDAPAIQATEAFQQHLEVEPPRVAKRLRAELEEDGGQGGGRYQEAQTSQDKQEEQADPPRDKYARSHKLENTNEHEDIEPDSESMANFLNPLDCCFGPVPNVFGTMGKRIQQTNKWQRVY